MRLNHLFLLWRKHTLFRSAFRRFEDLRVYQLAENLADEIWDIVVGWEYFAKVTVGKQMLNELGPSLNAYLKSIGAK